MAPTSAAPVAVLLPAAALMVLQFLAAAAAAAAAAAPPRAPIGPPTNCSTSCGAVSVPYPFGFGHSGCYWPGLNLTCDTSHHPPRLLLGDGTLRVTDIYLENATVRVMMSDTDDSILHAAIGDLASSDGWNVSFGRGFTDHGYRLSYKNELLVFGSDVMGSLLADIGENNDPVIIAGCASICTRRANDGDDDDGVFDRMSDEVAMTNRKYCTNNGAALWCCQAPLGATVMPREVQARWLYNGNQHNTQLADLDVLVAEEGWLDQNTNLVDLDVLHEVPLVLRWSVTLGLPQYLDEGYGRCGDDLWSMLCKSQHSYCWAHNPSGYTCHCEDGYQGNAYLHGGCQDVNECKLPCEENGCLFGACINTVGSMECWCPYGTYGDPGDNGGCIRTNYTTETDPGSEPSPTLPSL